MSSNTDWKLLFSEKQVKMFEAYRKFGSSRKASKEIGVNRRTIDRCVHKVKAKLAEQGIAPDHLLSTVGVPPGLSLTGTTTLVDAEGKPKIQWIQARAKKNLDDMQDAIRDAFEEYTGKGGKAKPPKVSNKDLLTVYPMGDPHIGMYCWAAESGADFDTDMATAQLTEAMGRLVTASPPSKYAIILNLGDFFHSDTLDNETRRSGHSLDVDTRMNRVWSMGMDALLTCVDLARKKHQYVIVRNEIGNHDDHTAMLLSIAMEAWFKDDPRVHIDRSPAKFWYYKFGKCLIGSTHGDTAKFPKLQGIMAADKPEAWGKTLYRYWYTGHFHSSKIEEYPGVLCEQFRTLAAKDAWTAGAGWRSGRDMRCIVLDRNRGETERHRVDVNELDSK